MDPRKLKIAFDDTLEILEENLREEPFDVYGFMNFVVKGMRLPYDYIVETGKSQHLPNGTWTGLIGLLNRSEVDFVPAAFNLNEERWDAAAFNYPYVCDDFTFVARNPSYHPEIMAIFHTLSAPVWLSLLISIILVTLVLFLVLRYRYTLDDVMLHVLAIGLNQEGNIIPKRAAEIVLVCSWMLVMTIFTACFKSVLLSFLSFPPLTGVRTVPELAAAIRDGKYSAMTVADSFLPLHLQESPNEDTRLIGESLLKHPPGMPDALFNKSFSANVVYAGSRSSVEYLEEKLYLSKDSMGFTIKASAVRKDFCFRDEIDMIIHRFLAAGIDQKINRLTRHKFAFYYFSDLPDDDTLRKITLTDIAGAFIILVAGYYLSACMLIIELAMERR